MFTHSVYYNYRDYHICSHHAHIGHGETVNYWGSWAVCCVHLIVVLIVYCFVIF